MIVYGSKGLSLRINCSILYLLTSVYPFFQNQFKDVKDQDQNDIVKLFVQYLPSIAMSIINILVPMVFNVVIRAEDYTPPMVIKITLFR